MERWRAELGQCCTVPPAGYVTQSVINWASQLTLEGEGEPKGIVNHRGHDHVQSQNEASIPNDYLSVNLGGAEGLHQFLLRQLMFSAHNNYMLITPPCCFEAKGM